MNQQFLDDLQQLENSLEPQVQQVVTTSHSHLLNDKDFLDHLESIDCQGSPKDLVQNIETHNYLVSIEREISSLAKFVKDIYKKRFPEIQSIVVNPVQYIRTVTVIQSIKDKLSQKDLSFLSPHQALSVTIAISSSHDQLDPKDAAQLKTSCQDVLRLFQYKERLFKYVQSSINSMCPNLCRLVGTVVACKLVTIAGGLKELANIPACNIQVLGGERGPNLGFGLMTRNHTGVFGAMDIVQNAPAQFQMELVRMFANKVAIAARIDKCGTCPNGFEGDKLRQALMERFQKIQEKGLVAHQRALAIPGQEPKKKRGGKRLRRQKELMGQTQVRKLQNRMKFNQVEEETVDGVGKGMIKTGGRIRVQIKKNQKLNPGKKILAQLKRSQQAGIESTLGFDSTHQMELINPDKSSQKKGTETYFNKSSGFKTILQEKMRKA